MDLQNNVLQQVVHRIESIESILIDVSSVIAEIDVLLGWSFVCSECNFSRPTVADDTVIHIKVSFALSITSRMEDILCRN